MTTYIGQRAYLSEIMEQQNNPHKSTIPQTPILSLPTSDNNNTGIYVGLSILFGLIFGYAISEMIKK
jgi:hypothetical protein